MPTYQVLDEKLIPWHLSFCINMGHVISNTKYYFVVIFLLNFSFILNVLQVWGHGCHLHLFIYKIKQVKFEKNM